MTHNRPMTDPGVVDVRFQPTAAEYRSATIHTVRGTTVPVAIGAFMIGTSSWQILNGDLILWVGLAFGLLVVSGLFVVPFEAGWASRRRPPTPRPHELRVDPGGIELVTTTTSTKQSWAVFEGVKEISGAYLLDFGGRTVGLVPKRVFSDDQRGDFVAIVEARGRLDRPSETRVWLTGVALGLTIAVAYMTGVSAILRGGSS
jgi:hypothetical protein